jgi:scyllo-inositol 2-dehydrogenase (NADP+)
MKKIQTAIVGYGKSAKVFHLPYLNSISNFEIKAFVSSQESNIKKNFPSSSIYSSLEELCLDSNIELVVLCSPTFLHYDQAKILLEANKHLVIEKPFTVTVKEAEELVKIAQERNLKLSVYHNRRWDSPFLTLKQLIKEGKLGDIHHYEVHYDRWRPNVQERWREKNIQGSGILYDLGSHVIDQVLDLFGQPKDIIQDIECQRIGSETIDYFHLIFKYEKMRAILHASSLVQAPRDHLVVHGSKASFIHELMDPQEAQLMLGKSPSAIKKQETAKIFFKKGDSVIEETISTISGGYEEFYLQMAKSISTNEEVPINPIDVIENIRIIEKLSNKVSNFTHASS